MSKERNVKVAGPFMALWQFSGEYAYRVACCHARRGKTALYYLPHAPSPSPFPAAVAVAAAAVAFFDPRNSFCSRIRYERIRAGRLKKSRRFPPRARASLDYSRITSQGNYLFARRARKSLSREVRVSNNVFAAASSAPRDSPRVFRRLKRARSRK